MLDGRSYEQSVYDNWTLLLDGTLLHKKLPVIITVGRDENQHVIYGYRLWNGEGDGLSDNYLTNICSSAERHTKRRLDEFTTVGLHDDIAAANQFHTEMIENDRSAREEAVRKKRAEREKAARVERDRMLLERADWRHPEYVDLMIRQMMERLDRAANDAADRILSVG